VAISGLDGWLESCIFRMANRKPRIGRILVTALTVLVLCGIVAAELPELLSLTDDTTNDFSLRNTNILVSPVRLDAHRPVAIVDPDANPAGSRFFLLRPNLFNPAALTPSELFLLYSVLRT